MDDEDPPEVIRRTFPSPNVTCHRPSPADRRIVPPRLELYMMPYSPAARRTAHHVAVSRHLTRFASSGRRDEYVEPDTVAALKAIHLPSGDHRR